MGQPLFSHSYPSIPLVRTEPDPIPPVRCEKWSYWNPFDPDSDEFCENDPVYEAFILPPPSPQPDLAFILDPDDGTTSDPSSHPDLSAIPTHTSPSFDTPMFIRGNRQRFATLTVLPAPTAIDILPRTSTITPIPIPSRPILLRSTTPPPESSLPPTPPPFELISPAPIPFIPGSPSPRILTWSSRPPFPSPSPSPSGPLTNPDARMSLAHIAPTAIRVSDAL